MCLTLNSCQILSVLRLFDLVLYYSDELFVYRHHACICHLYIRHGQYMGVDTVYNVGGGGGGLNDHCAQSARNFSTLLLKMS